jgi:hypothetical protein
VKYICGNAADVKMLQSAPGRVVAAARRQLQASQMLTRLASCNPSGVQLAEPQQASL